MASELQAVISKAYNVAATLCPGQREGINASPQSSPQMTRIKYLHLWHNRKSGPSPHSPSKNQMGQHCHGFDAPVERKQGEGGNRKNLQAQRKPREWGHTSRAQLGQPSGWSGSVVPWPQPPRVVYRKLRGRSPSDEIGFDCHVTPNGASVTGALAFPPVSSTLPPSS